MPLPASPPARAPPAAKPKIIPYSFFFEVRLPVPLSRQFPDIHPHRYPSVKSLPTLYKALLRNPSRRNSYPLMTYCSLITVLESFEPEPLSFPELSEPVELLLPEDLPPRDFPDPPAFSYCRLTVLWQEPRRGRNRRGFFQTGTGTISLATFFDTHI